MKTRTLTLAAVAMAGLAAACDDSTTPPPPVARAVLFARGGNSDNNGRILFSSDRELPGSPDVYAMNADGSGVTRLTSDPAGDAYPQEDMFAVRADGTGRTQLTFTPASDAYPSWRG